MGRKVEKQQEAGWRRESWCWVPGGYDACIPSQVLLNRVKVCSGPTTSIQYFSEKRSAT
jgi:hypothetical protein